MLLSETKEVSRIGRDVQEPVRRTAAVDHVEKNNQNVVGCVV